MDTPIITPAAAGGRRRRRRVSGRSSARLWEGSRAGWFFHRFFCLPALLVGGIVSGVLSAVSAITGGGSGPQPIRSRTQISLSLLSQPGELSSQDYLRIQEYIAGRGAAVHRRCPTSSRSGSDSAKAAIDNIR